MTGIAQKYSRAVNSSDLRDDDRHSATDVLAAVALSSTLGSELFRAKYSSDRTELPSSNLISIWRDIILKKATKRRWAEHSHEVADLSLMFWLDDICEACGGKGHPKVVSAPTLEACVCPACDGSGKRKLRCRHEVKEYILDAIQRLELMEREAGSAAIKKLSDEARF